MRCKSCNKNLSDFESTRKYNDMSFVDMCTPCFKATEYQGVVVDREDLRQIDEDNSEFNEEFEEATDGELE